MDRRGIEVSGIVQGVGFRPFVFDLARRLGLRGSVRNRAGNVWIEVEGDPAALDRFLADLAIRPPPLARIDEVKWRPVPSLGEPDFWIEPSEIEVAGSIFIAPDIATCDDCLRELWEPRDRRYRYPFLNCTNCGPRLTIIRGAPYDRERTTMAAFAMCRDCRSEFEDPRDRRYHAQPIACPACGPSLRAVDREGRTLDGPEPLAHAVAILKRGGIVAIKSLGGYHLACSAVDGRAVAELRRRKHRDEKPLAVMVRDLGSASDLCEVGADERGLLESSRRPIVLLRSRPARRLADEVAPGNPYLGVMLPYTPMHHLLLQELDGLPLVMTSGNRSDEPIAHEDDDARERLASIADVYLTHDRAIHLRSDDSVTRWVAGAELPIRRARGDAPRPIPLPRPCPRPTLAVGGQLKAAFALGRGGHAFPSHHLGDLDHYRAYRAYIEAIEHYERLFAIRPERIVHDLHPDYATTRYARDRADTMGIARHEVQHHHAHLASCLADNGVDDPAIGVIFDGTGFGTDGAVWGGEFLVGDFRTFRRAGHFRYVKMPGGDRAIREPWRMATSHLLDSGSPPELTQARTSHAEIKMIAKMMEARLNSPPTSSVGRLFDAVAALAGIRDRVSYEGQAAMELEWLAMGEPPDGRYPFEVGIERGSGPDVPLIVDTRPLIRAVADDVRRGESPARVARRFQTTLVDVIAEVCERLRRRSGLDAVALSGGVFLNALLLDESVARLGRDGFRVYRHRRVPPGDGGLSLGQLAISASMSD
ncbi:carbamoyltransferase HypF [Tundrisphaera lichenicola]|uniref:carbamoyltransferase HypF n=1 Tax=Tundrisphaera lichenicola TaxID=2029860 RepID=UPI003EBF0B7D